MNDKKLNFDEIYEFSKHQKTFPLPKRKLKQLGLSKPQLIQTESRRKRIYDRGNGMCYLCGDAVTFNEMTIDHVIPKSRGGKNNIENLRPTHYKCNFEKGNKIL
jgi:5-methylcytosine-specific restriction endonuclease McrA